MRYSDKHELCALAHYKNVFQRHVCVVKRKKRRDIALREKNFMRTLSYEMLNDHFCFYFNIFFGKNFYRREFASCKPLYRNKK